jgi:glycosyltransferase involved in cell wall biosynthesis
MISGGLRQWNAEVVLSERVALDVEPAQITNPYDPAALDLTIFVSCYNEAPYIVDTLNTVCAAAREVGLSFEVIVIDDGSKDNSRELVRDYIARHPEENLILRANHVNKGLAQNYVDGAFMGRGKYYRLICGDNSEPKETIVTVLKAIGEADIIIPYYLSNEGKGFRRELISKCYTALINLITGNKIRYYNGLPVHLRVNVMRWHSNTRGFGFQADLLCLLLDLDFSYREIQVVIVERREGRSNALTFRNLLSVGHTIFEIFTRRVSKWLYHKPFRD